MKCDFCDKEAVGYVSMHAALYCADHQEAAEEIESTMENASTSPNLDKAVDMYKQGALEGHAGDTLFPLIFDSLVEIKEELERLKKESKP